jgi:hypothetical protein
VTNPFSLFDIPIAAFILFAIIAPERFIRLGKMPEEKQAAWLPRVRPLGLGDSSWPISSHGSMI